MTTLNDQDLDSMADFLLGRANKVKRIEPPIDLFELAKIQRVTAVDLRPMLPTGGLSRRSSGFWICIQDLRRTQPIEVAVGSPVEDRPRLTTRQRFTMAHELAHTLLFDTSDPPQPRAGCPKGAKLEALCHRAARRILMPPALVTAEVAKREKLGARDILDLARLFDVSPEIALWRCDELSAVRDSDRVVLYVRKSFSGADEIAGFFCSSWFQDRKGRPELGMPPAKWLSGLVDESFWSDPKATSMFSDVKEEIGITRVPFAKTAHFIELELRRPDDSSRASDRVNGDPV
ncbi:MAG: ImmA/IrrE family metallo-endopeptidase [Candidatus Solibacter usitatus]|nr:ImmA/IrrE family metallo-endopeptidase [Candidatus Solibacter usitatus]